MLEQNRLFIKYATVMQHLEADRAIGWECSSNAKQQVVLALSHTHTPKDDSQLKTHGDDVEAQ